VLTSLSRKLEHGAFVTVTGYAYRNSSLARKRASIVAHYLESKIATHVTLKIVTTSSVAKVLVTTTKQ
jgi:hypothetical protein